MNSSTFTRKVDRTTVTTRMPDGTVVTEHRNIEEHTTGIGGSFSEGDDILRMLLEITTSGKIGAGHPRMSLTDDGAVSGPEDSDGSITRLLRNRRSAPRLEGPKSDRRSDMREFLAGRRAAMATAGTDGAGAASGRASEPKLCMNRRCELTRFAIEHRIGERLPGGSRCQVCNSRACKLKSEHIYSRDADCIGCPTAKKVDTPPAATPSAPHDVTLSDDPFKLTETSQPVTRSALESRAVATAATHHSDSSVGNGVVGSGVLGNRFSRAAGAGAGAGAEAAPADASAAAATGASSRSNSPIRVRSAADMPAI